MVRHFLKLAMAAAVVAVPMQAQSNTVGDTGNVQFNGTVTHTCTINVTGSGTLVSDANFENLGSNIGAGSAGTAQIVATGNTFQMSIDTPSAFITEPAANTTGETFNGSFSTSGANSLTGSAAGGSNSGGQTIAMGTTNVEVDLVASKSPGDVFEAGAYNATVLLRCE